MTRLLRTIFATSVLVVGGVRPDPWAAEVVRTLEVARRELGATAGRAEGGIRTRLLREGESWSVEVPLAANTEYVVVAACDQDCGRLGLRVSDPRHYDLGADQSATRRPALRFRSTVEGPHQFVVTLTACRVDPCRVGILVLRR